MSSSDASHNESPPDGRGPAEPESPEEETATPSEGSPEPIECPNCGHEFTGNYCPECGQEANPSVSIAEVIGGFFRQFGDLDHGFWPTFVGLTVRPGDARMSRYLDFEASLPDAGSDDIFYTSSIRRS